MLHSCAFSAKISIEDWKMMHQRAWFQLRKKLTSFGFLDIMNRGIFYKKLPQQHSFQQVAIKKLFLDFEIFQVLNHQLVACKCHQLVGDSLLFWTWKFLGSNERQGVVRFVSSKNFRQGFADNLLANCRLGKNFFFFH